MPASALSELEHSAASAARLLKIMASEQRLLILCRLAQGEASVGVLSDCAHLTQTGASQHLARMRSEGLVATRRDGQTIWYRLENAAIAHVMQALCDIYGSHRYGSHKARVEPELA
ncbi:MAG TPA: metalloregulator ArsR/SmtB family transcription factor [Asticcacaulis sp.]|nr:metalloregulator ArsR/SmtB family transcription factor [Asticcacaulis sp.]